MVQKKRTEEEKKYVAETALDLSSDKEDKVIAKLNEIKTRGKASILPYVLDLLNSSKSDKVKQEVILIISNLKDQSGVPSIIKFIQKNQLHALISQVIAACWQSGLNYSMYLKTFGECFISGDYQVALESFTVIEEMLWQSDDKSISECRKILNEGEKEISTEKAPLFKELIKVLDEGKSKSHDDYSNLID